MDTWLGSTSDPNLIFIGVCARCRGQQHAAVCDQLNDIMCTEAPATKTDWPRNVVRCTVRASGCTRARAHARTNTQSGIFSTRQLCECVCLQFGLQQTEKGVAAVFQKYFHTTHQTSCGGNFALTRFFSNAT